MTKHVCALTVNVDEANATLDEDQGGTWPAVVDECVSVTTAVVNNLERSRQETWQRITPTFIPLSGSSRT